jgi:serine/threonine protein kinase/WD40 repeat protein
MSDVSRVEEVFLAAVEKLDPVQRAMYLDAACSGDEDLRRRVETLLAAQPQVGQFLESPVNLEPTGVYLDRESKLESTASIGDRVGPYKLLERIGEGGMGEVWVADQQEPIKRRVALKLIKPGMDSRSVLGRFEAERQALAVMDHPNISKVLDAGTTKDGRPYFVMELVKGTPITEFADARKLTPKQRLELFVPVCQAIQHAHMKGIIHRDIKPSNVLVALHDEMPVPKVIDFGVAKAVGQQLTEKTIYTGFGALVGTPAYMAPEQATFNQLDIDTRADVYALGVLLYELLAGSPPIESERLKKAALDEVLRIVRDEEPPRPSQRLSTSHLKASIAATRGSEPLRLSQLMRGELDWIVMKALEKDRTRRYETAIGFAADIQRYLGGEQVQAVPPSLGYRLRKAYRRNRVAVLVGTAFTALILVAAVAGGILGYEARRAEALAEARRIEAETQKAIAEKQRDRATKLSVDAQLRAASSRIDLNLQEYDRDSQIGLLRLARPLDSGASVTEMAEDTDGDIARVSTRVNANHEFVKLREFQTAAVITAGQEFVPLVLIEESNTLNTSFFDSNCNVSRDERLLIWGDERTGLKLLELPSLAVQGIFREANERLTAWGFSPDSRTVWTQDTDSILRFWNTDGTFRAETPLREDRFLYPAGMTMENLRYSIRIQPLNDVLVSDGVVVCRTEYPDWEWQSDDTGQRTWMEPKKGSIARKGPVELYSTRTGQFIRRIDRLDQKLSDWQLSPDKRWLIYVDYDATDPQVVILSSADGQELARLDHRLDGTDEISVQVSPTGKWVLTMDHDIISGGEKVPYAERIRLWSSATWRLADERVLHEVAIPKDLESKDPPHFVADDVLAFRLSDGNVGLLRLGQQFQVFRKEQLGLDEVIFESLSVAINETMIFGDDLFELTDVKTFQRLEPPPGRSYATELAKVAPDGRFFGSLDTVTEKYLPSPYGYHHRPFHPGLGVVESIEGFGDDLYHLCILPDPSKLVIPPAMLELWAQVVTGGELGADGQFEAWDEPTWQAKQKELAAMEPPYKDFPFPGWVATEPHLWWHIQGYQRIVNLDDDDYDEQLYNEFKKLSDEWRRRSGRSRPEPEPDTWRTPGPVQPTEELQPSTSGSSSVSDAPNKQP